VSNLKSAVKARRFLVLMFVLHSFMLLPYCYVWIFNRTTEMSPFSAGKGAGKSLRQG